MRGLVRGGRARRGRVVAAGAAALAAMAALAGAAPAGAAPAGADGGFAAMVARASVPDGAAIVSGECAGCHSLARGGPSLVGPDLYGVYGRRIASVPGYAYSSALRARSGVWDAASLDPWLLDPTADIPGTKMVIGGIGDVGRRAAVVAFLRTLGDRPPAPR